MRLSAGLLLAFVLIGLGPRAGAAEADVTPESAADAVLAAAEKKDEPALEALASRRHPDPWLVAEVLDARGHCQVAAHFAQHATGKATEDLADHLADTPKPPVQAAARAALAKAQAALAEGTAQAALEALKDLPGDARTITAVRIHFARGEALRLARQPNACVEAYERAARLAEDLGWLAMASRALVACGRAHWGRDFRAAHTAFKSLLRIEERLDSSVGQGRAHYFQYLTGDELGRPRTEVRAHLGKAHDLAKAGGDAEYLARTLGTLTRISHRPPREKLNAYCRAADALKGVTGAGLASRFQPDPHRIARDRIGLLLDCASAARAIGDIGDEEIAREYARLAIETAAEDGNPELESTARAFLATVEASLFERTERNAEALAQLEEARALYAGMQKHRRDLARVLHRIASLHVRLGHLPRAQSLIQEAQGIFEDLGVAPDRCRALILGAKIDLNLGRSRAAREQLAEAEALAGVLKDAGLQAEVLIGQAQIHRRHARHARALAMLERARELAAASHSPLLIGLVHLRLGQLQRELGSTEAALAAVQAAIGALEPTPHTHVLRQAREAYAGLLLDRGRLGEAYRLLQALLGERREGGDDIGTAAAYDALANVRFLQGRQLKKKDERVQRFQEAQALRVQALRLFERCHARRRAAVVRSQLGRDLYLAGEDATAFQQLEKAFHECRELADPDGAATCAHALAEVHSWEQAWAEALSWCERGLDLASDYGLDLAVGDSERARGTRLVPRYEIGAEAAYRLGDAGKLHDFFDRGRAAVLLSALGGREALREAGVDEELRAEEERAREALVHAYEAMQEVQRSNDQRARNAASKTLRAAQKAVHDAILAIRSEVRMQADLAYPSTASVAEVRAQLRPSDAFLEYGVINGALVAVILTKEDARHVGLGPVETVRAAVQRLLGHEDDTIAPEFAGEVRKLLLDKLALGKGIARLLISPHGDLAYVPFALLDRKREICFLPSATVFTALREEEEKEDTRGRSILALGDPDYSSTDGGPPRHQALPNSGHEVKAIADPRRGDVRLLRAAASETGFKRALDEKKGRWRAVHFACHGIVDAENPRASRLALTRDGENDGYLEALEVFNMQVPADLVVLSGCETGGGKVIEGEGLEGLTRAFMFAGAPRVIASLWAVDDHATQALMNEFYRLWNGKDGLGAAAALRAAQDYLQRHPKHPEWKEPKYWAAWVLWGLPD